MNALLFALWLSVAFFVEDSCRNHCNKKMLPTAKGLEQQFDQVNEGPVIIWL